MRVGLGMARVRPGLHPLAVAEGGNALAAHAADRAVARGVHALVGRAGRRRRGSRVDDSTGTRGLLDRRTRGSISKSCKKKKKKKFS